MKKRIQKLIVVDFSTEPRTKANKDRWVCVCVRARLWVRLTNPQIPLNEHVYEWAVSEHVSWKLPIGIKSTPKANYSLCVQCSLHETRWSVKWTLNALYFGNGQSTSHSLCISIFHSNHSRTRFFLGHFLLGSVQSECGGLRNCSKVITLQLPVLSDSNCIKLYTLIDESSFISTSLSCIWECVLCVFVFLLFFRSKCTLFVGLFIS